MVTSVVTAVPGAPVLLVAETPDVERVVVEGTVSVSVLPGVGLHIAGNVHTGLLTPFA